MPVRRRSVRRRLRRAERVFLVLVVCSVDSYREWGLVGLREDSCVRAEGCGDAKPEYGTGETERKRRTT